MICVYFYPFLGTWTYFKRNTEVNPQSFSFLKKCLQNITEDQEPSLEYFFELCNTLLSLFFFKSKIKMKWGIFLRNISQKTSPRMLQLTGATI